MAGSMIPGLTCGGLDGERCCFFHPIEDWVPGTDMRRGQCRAKPPSGIVTADGPRTIFPMVRPDWWCGGHSFIEPKD